MPKVSVVIPIYNVEAYLEEALGSIVSQTLKDIEIICINDGSTDKSGEIIEKFAAEDKRIRPIHQENKGLGKTRNKGIRSATGEFIYFFDSDDKLEENALESLYNTAKSNDADLVLFEAVSFYESKELEEKHPGYKTLYRRKKKYPEIYNGQQAFNLLCENWDFIVSSCLKLHARKILIEKEIFFPENIYFEDEFFSVCSVLAAERVKIVDDAFFHRRVRDNSIITDSAKDYIKFVSYYKTAQMILDYIAKNDLGEDTTHWLTYRASSFINSANNFYQNLDDSFKEKAKNDPDIPVMDWQLLFPVLSYGRQYFFEERKFRSHNEVVEKLRDDVRALNKEKRERYEILQSLYKERKILKKEIARFKKIHKNSIVIRGDKGITGLIVRALKKIKRMLKK